MDIVDRIRQLANQKEVSLTKIEKALGFGNGTIGKWVKQSPSCEKIKLVADYLNTSTDYLIYGGGSTLDRDELLLLDNFRSLDSDYKNRVLERAETLKEIYQTEKQKVIEMQTTQSNSNSNSEPDFPNDITEDDEDGEEYIYLPFFDLPVSAGTGVYLDSENTTKIRVPADEAIRRANYALRVSGDSMEPRYYDGDIVLVRQQQSVEIGEVGIFSYNDEGYIKLFGGNRLISLNPNYKDKEITESDSFFCLGKVIGILSIEHKFK